MKNKAKFAVLGGDFRQYAAALELCRKGISVYVSGLSVDKSDEKDIKFCEDIAEALSDADAVVLPLPASVDGIVLNCPGYRNSERVPLERIIELMSERSILFGGRIPQSAVVKAQGKGIKVFDYFLSEKLQIKNAYITAEAAVSIAMNSLDKCVRDASFAITGSGRIARLLADLLRRMGARVTVCARNADSLVYFELLGCDTLHIRECDDKKKWYRQLENGYDVIFNTVPSWLFDREFLEHIDKGLLFIELASAPGGVDICAARELGSNVLWASSLPGKYAPHSAGVIIAQCIEEILHSEEVDLL